jgi:uncharacterized membrane protein YhaH (DUF805 family)
MDSGNLLNLLFSFEGRINRAKYWLAAVTWIVAWVIVVAVVGASGFSTVGLGLFILLLIPSCISGFAIGIKRLHDRDKSGWWLLFFYLGPNVLSAVAGVAGPFRWIFLLASFAVSVWMIVELGCLRGTAGPNKYGPDPLGAAAAATRLIR